ncbi:MAG: hypothetical protein ABI024_17600 [Vicinamibacterales bacterium]
MLAMTIKVTPATLNTEMTTLGSTHSHAKTASSASKAYETDELCGTLVQDHFLMPLGMR